MRKITIVLVLFSFCFTLSAYSQNIIPEEIKDRRIYQKIEKLKHFAPQQQGIHKMMDQHLLLENYVRQSYFDGDWENYSRADFTYENGLRTVELNQQYDEVNGWINSYRSLYSYSGNLLTESTTQFWENETWTNADQEVYTYQEVNGSQVLSTVMNSEWDGDEWVPDIQFDVDFSGGTFNSFTMSWWNQGATQWIPAFRTVLSEESGDLLVVEEEWDGSNWFPEYRTIYPGFTKNSFYDQIIKEFDITFLGSWLYFMYQIEFPEFTEQYWDGDEWVNDWRMRQETEGPVLQYLFEYYLEGSGWIVEEIYEYETGTSGLLEKATEYYSDFEGGISAFYSEDFLYGSETNNLETINQFDLYDGSSELEGRILLDWGMATSVTENLQQPQTFQLGNAYPNPFNPSTMIPFRMASNGHASIRVYDMLGRQAAVLVNEIVPAGEYTVRFDAHGLSSGVYFVRFETAGVQQTRSITLIK